MEDKFKEPSITHLQKLGPEHLKQIFESSRWVFSMGKNLAFKVCVRLLPTLKYPQLGLDIYIRRQLLQQSITDYLEKIDPKLSAQYLEYIIADKQEENSTYDQLVELYSSMMVTAGTRGDESKSCVIF